MVTPRHHGVDLEQGLRSDAPAPTQYTFLALFGTMWNIVPRPHLLKTAPRRPKTRTARRHSQALLRFRRLPEIIFKVEFMNVTIFDPGLSASFRHRDFVPSSSQHTKKIAVASQWLAKHIDDLLFGVLPIGP